MQADVSLVFARQMHAEGRVEAESRYSVGFFFFLLVNAVLFIRPGELWVGLEGWPIYNVLIVCAIITSFGVLVRQLSWGDLKANPGTLCVVGMLGAVMLSFLAQRNFWMTRVAFEDFYKIVLYYLLLVGLVNTPKRLGRFIGFVGACVVVIAGLCVLQYHGRIELPGISFIERVNGTDPVTGEASIVMQLCGPGIFSDPNDLSLILVATMLILAHFILESKNTLLRLACVLTLPLVGYAFALTNSRGGFLALLGGGLTLIVSRFGWKKSIPVAVLVLPAMLFLFAGRQTDINMNGDDTASGRMQLWKEGFMLMKSSPIFGIGYLNLQEEIQHVAHNSFVQSFVETGLVGGTIFTSAVYLPIMVLRRRSAVTAGVGVDPDLTGWRPCLLAMLTAYAVGMSSLTRCYTISTYVIIGLGGAYARLLWMQRPAATPVLDKQLVKRLVKVSMGVLVVFYGMARFLT